MSNNKRPADHILLGLHIGPIEDVAESPTDYDAILSVCQDNRRENVPETVPYRHVELADDEHSEAEWGGSCSYQTFATAVDWLRNTHSMLFGGRRCETPTPECDSNTVARCSGSDTLVHCHNGVNRSVAVTAAYLGCRYGLTHREAINLIQQKRPVADPNDLMRRHARRYIQDHADE